MKMNIRGRVILSARLQTLVMHEKLMGNKQKFRLKLLCEEWKQKGGQTLKMLIFSMETSDILEKAHCNIPVFIWRGLIIHDEHREFIIFCQVLSLHVFSSELFHVFRNGLKIHLHWQKRRRFQTKQRQWPKKKFAFAFAQCKWAFTGEAFVWCAIYPRVFTERLFKF